MGFGSANSIEKDPDERTREDGVVKQKQKQASQTQVELPERTAPNGGVCTRMKVETPDMWKGNPCGWVTCRMHGYIQRLISLRGGARGGVRVCLKKKVSNQKKCPTRYLSRRCCGCGGVVAGIPSVT